MTLKKSQSSDPEADTLVLGLVWACDRDLGWFFFSEESKDAELSRSIAQLRSLMESGGDIRRTCQTVIDSLASGFRGARPSDQKKKSNIVPMPVPMRNFDEPQELREAQLPYYESIPAGKPGDVTPDDYYSTIGVLRSLAKPGRYVLKVDGDSMAPKIEDGDLVLVDTNPFPRSRQIVVALLNGEGTLKQLIRKKRQIILHPLNPEHDDIPIKESDELQIQGVVIELVRRRF